MGSTVLRLSGITKRFGELVANEDISLALDAGEVLALLGENGAGKSTLVSILFGHYVADAGAIEAFGRPLPPGDTRAALAAGIGMVHQHFTLADNLSVLDNVLVGFEALWKPRSARGQVRERLLRCAADYGLAVDPEARVGDLSVGERQRVEILKALVRGARILILDEPTAVLTPQESESLFATLRRFVDAGLSLIFISHKLDEVLRVSDRVAVLRAGRLVAEVPSRTASAAQLAELMVGRAFTLPHREPHPAGEVVLSLRGVSCAQDERRLLADVGLEVRAGEILAVAGVAGNGQQALAEVLSGTRRADTGEVRLHGRPVPASARAWIDAGVARIPEDRLALGVVADASLTENAVVERCRSSEVLRWPALSRLVAVLDRGRMRAAARSIVDRFDVRHASLQQPIRMLSGGNVQKFILGRELSREPALIVANQPTWGLDVGAVAYVHRQLLEARRRGAAILLISEELEEIFALADRISVMFHGRLGPARPSAAWTAETIGLAMVGREVSS